MMVRRQCKKMFVILLLAISYWLIIAALPTFYTFELPYHHLPSFDLFSPQSPVLDGILLISNSV